MTNDSLLDAFSPRVLLGGFVVVIVLAVGAAAVTSTASFGPYNSAWDGTSTARSAVAADSPSQPVVVDTAAYDRFAGNGTLVIILAPQEEYSEADIARLRAFVARGGTLLVAEDRRVATNQLLDGLDVSTRIDGRPVRDPQRYHRSPALPILSETTNASVIQNETQFTLNHGTVLRSTNGTAVVFTSEFAYIDANRNEQLDQSEQLRAYPVLSSEQRGDGRVLVLSDPSVFINQMLERPGNQALLDQLLMSHGRVVFDASHTSDVLPAAVFWLWLHRTAWAQAMLGGSGVLLVVLSTYAGVRQRIHRTVRTAVARVNPRSQSSIDAVTLDTEERIRFLQRRHPEWEPERVRRIAESMGQLNDQSGVDSDE